MSDELNWLPKDDFIPEGEEGQEALENKEDKETNEQESSEGATEEKEEVVNEEKPEKEEGKEGPKAEEDSEEGKEDKKEEVQEDDASEVSEEPVEEERSLNESETEEEEVEYETYTAASILEDLNEAVREVHGEDISLSDIIELQSKDFDNMDELSLLEEYQYFQDPDIDDRVLNYEMKKYALLQKSKDEIEEMIEDGEITRDDYEALEISFIKEVNKARRELKDFQSQVNINDLEIYSQPAGKQQPQQTQEEREAEAKAYQERIDSFGDRTLQVGTKEDPQELTIARSDDDRSGIRDFISNGEDGSSWIIRQWFGNGQLNIDKLIDDVDKMINYDRDVAIAYTQGANDKLSKEVKDIDNINFEKGQSKGTSDGELSEAAKIVREIN